MLDHLHADTGFLIVCFKCAAILQLEILLLFGKALT